MPEQSTQVAQKFDLGANVLAPAVSSLGEIGKIYVAGEAAKGLAKEARKGGATGTSFAVVAGILVLGVLGFTALMVVAAKKK